MKEVIFEILENRRITPGGIFRTELAGDTSDIARPGQFVGLKLDGLYLRRPVSVCDAAPGRLTLIWRVVGAGTRQMSEMRPGDRLSALSGLGNGFDAGASGDRPLLVGGGVGVPPLYYLAKKLREAGKDTAVVLGFATASEAILAREFAGLGCDVTVTTVDGTAGTRGFVTDALPAGRTYFYSCGPEAMMKALNGALGIPGEFSLEERMGCGFGACMGCSRMTVSGSKRVCRDGPVFRKEELIW